MTRKGVIQGGVKAAKATISEATHVDEIIQSKAIHLTHAAKYKKKSDTRKRLFLCLFRK